MTIEAAAAGLKWVSLAKIAGQAVVWAITLVVIRILDPSDYGIAAIAAVFVALLGSVAELGLGAALVQARTLDDEQIARVAGFALVLNAGCALLICAASPLVGWAFGDARIGVVAAVASTTLVLNAIATVPESLAYREMRFKRLALIDLVSSAAGSATTLAMALAGWGVWSLVAGSIAVAAVRTAGLVHCSRWVPPRLSLHRGMRHLRFGGTLTAGRLAWQGAQQCDVLIGARMLTEGALGLYSVAVHLARMPMHKVMSVINQVAFPAVARMQDEPVRLAARLLDAVSLLALLTLPLLWGLSSVAPEFVAVLLGAQWHGAIVPLQFAALAVPLQLFSNVLSTALTGLGHADLELRNMLTTLCVTVIAVLIGVREGAPGLAAAGCAAAPLVLALNFPRTNRVLALPVAAILRVTRGPLVAAAAMYAAVAGARLVLVDLDASLRLVALIAVGAMTYTGAITVLDPRSWTLLRRATAMLRSA